jgi:arsenite methyltransferase
MSENTASKLYETERMQNITGKAIRPGGLELTSRALEFCDFAQGSTILDIGCGLGTTQNLLTNLGFNSFGIDISPIQIKNNTSYPIFQILAAGELVPFIENSMDGVFIECTLSVVLQPKKVIAEAYRLLKPGGLLILSDIYARNIYGIPPLRSALSNGCFNSIWSQREISTMIRSIGLEAVLWEDHCAAIRTLAGRIILDQGSMKTFWQTQNPCGKSTSVDALSFQLLLTRAKISYFLLIAQKPDR